MIVLGLDPGTRNCGWAVIEVAADRSAWTVLDLGSWNLLEAARRMEHDSALKVPELGARLEQLYTLSSELIKKWNPRWVGLEKAVHFKNPASSHKLSEARGVLRLALYQCLDQAGKRLVELSPTEVKRVMTGWGKSDKNSMIRALKLRAKLPPEVLERGERLRHDAFDAAAVAWATWLRAKRQRIETRELDVQLAKH